MLDDEAVELETVANDCDAEGSQTRVTWFVQGMLSPQQRRVAEVKSFES